MKHMYVPKRFPRRTRRNTFIQYFWSYFILFSILLLGFFFIMRGQVSNLYFEKLENEAGAILQNVTKELDNNLASINHIQNAINSNVEIILFHHDSKPWNQYLAFQELEKYALGNRMIDSIVYLDKSRGAILSTRRHVEYQNGVFYIYDGADSVAFAMENYPEEDSYLLTYVSNESTGYLIYYPNNIAAGSYSLFFIINLQELQHILKNALSEEIISMALITPPDNKIVAGANSSALEPYLADHTAGTRPGGMSVNTSLHTYTGIYSEFSMVALVSNDFLLKQMNTAFRNTYFTLLLLGVAGMLAVFLGMRRTFLPLHKLTKAIVKSPNFREGYVDQLTQAFSDTLTENKNLRTKTNKYRLAMQKSILSSIVSDSQFDGSESADSIDHFFNMEPDNHIVALQMKSRKALFPSGDIMRFFNKALPGTDSCILLESKGNAAVFLLNYTGAETDKDKVLHVLLDELYEKEGYLSAASNSSSSPLDIPFLYENALTASRHWEHAPVVSYAELSSEQDAHAVHSYPYDRLESLAGALKDQDFRTASAVLKELFHLTDSAFSRGSSLPDFFVRCVLIDVLTTIVNSMNQTNIKFKVYRDLYFETLYYCRSCPYDEAAAQIKDNTEKFLQLFEAELANKSITSPRIRQLIEEQYTSPDFSISSIADTFDVSVAYVSYLFKNETGENLSDYVWNLRLEKAKELLLTTDLSVDNISVSVGYISTSSFRRKFKQDMGVTPSEFRSKKGALPHPDPGAADFPGKEKLPS